MEKYGNENENTEFKKTTGELKEGVISIASILNKHGKGDLYFGIKNSGEVVGQEITDKTLREISQAISNHIKPAIYPKIEVEKYYDKEIIHVSFEGNKAPYLAYNIPRIRMADEDKVLDQDTYNYMLHKRDFSKPWELQVSNFTIDDVVKEDFRYYLQKAKDADRITFDSEEPLVVLNKLELLSDDEYHLLNAGAVLFCNSPLNDVQMAKFATNVKATFTDIRRFDKGSIIGLSKVCEQYIIDAMDWKADIVGLSRIETPEIPVAAIREAIINSYGHRVYDNYQNNEIDVFKDRIEIHTTGGFPDGHTPEEFLDGNRKAIRRNKLITSVLYFSNDMETFATGLKRIKDLCDEAGCKVEFRIEKDDFVVAFYRNLREEWNVDEIDDGLPQNYPKTTSKLPQNYPKTTSKLPQNYPKTTLRDYQETTKRLPRDYQDATKTKKEIIKDLLINNPTISVSEIADMIGITSDGVKHHLRKLKKAGEIERVGGTHGGKWKVLK